MKRKLLFILLAFLALVLVGCGSGTGNSTDNPGDTPENPPVIDPTGGEEELEQSFEKYSKYVNENIPYFITGDIELPDQLEGLNAYVEWQSSNEDVIDFAGNVNVNKTKAIEITLTYKVVVEELEKSGSINVIVTPFTPEEIEKKFAEQFSTLITRDYEVKDVYYELFEVIWVSTNTDVFDNEGNFERPLVDTEFKIQYSVNCKGYSGEQKEINLNAAAPSDYEKLQEVEEWIFEEVLHDLYITLDKLPSVYEKYNINLEWVSSNEDVIKPNGEITRYVYERYLNLSCKYSLDNGSGGQIDIMEVIVSALDTSKMTEEEILENFLLSLAVTNIDQISFGYTEAPNLSKTYNFVYFYENTETTIIEKMIPKGKSNRSGKSMDAQLVVVHDTGNPTGTAKGNAEYVQSGYGGSSTGWHYTTGVDGVFQTLPENECANHANGTQDQKFKLVDTGIKATARKPRVEMGKDNFIYINGEKTRISSPQRNAPLADDTLLVEIGENGNYWIPKLWYCEKYSSVATMGGNGSGIGIESAVITTEDYNVTVRKTAKLVAEILIRQELDITRVVQHNTTSGKNCPQAIREANYWYTFKDYVSMEKWAKENLSEYTFEWTSLSKFINDSGFISKTSAGNVVSYSVNVSKGDQVVLTKSYQTTLI